MWGLQFQAAYEMLLLMRHAIQLSSTIRVQKMFPGA